VAKFGILPRYTKALHEVFLKICEYVGPTLFTSVQRLFDNFVTHVLAERQLEARFAARQRRGNPERGRRLLAEIRERVS
jgi:hypothetical protein